MNPTICIICQDRMNGPERFPKVPSTQNPNICTRCETENLLPLYEAVYNPPTQNPHKAAPASPDDTGQGAATSWVSCEESLPDDEMTCDTWGPDYTEVSCAYHVGNLWVDMFTGRPTPVTHWRHRPEPPSVEIKYRVV